MIAAQTRQTVCSDGTIITHREVGNGPGLVLLPGWSQTAQAFSGQLTAHVLGHSMGCAVIWSYLELFGGDRLSTLVLVDQMPCALRNPAWTDEEALKAGATMDSVGLFAFTDLLRGDGPDPRSRFLADVTSPDIDPHQLSCLTEQSLRLDRRHAADLLFDVATHDWRTLIPRIRLPTLVIAGDSVNVPIASQRWMGRQIPRARFARVAGRGGGGSHFPFLEHPAEFDATVSAYLDDHNAQLTDAPST